MNEENEAKKIGKYLVKKLGEAIYEVDSLIDQSLIIKAQLKLIGETSKKLVFLRAEKELVNDLIEWLGESIYELDKQIDYCFIIRNQLRILANTIKKLGKKEVIKYE